MRRIQEIIKSCVKNSTESKKEAPAAATFVTHKGPQGEQNPAEHHPEWDKQEKRNEIVHNWLYNALCVGSDSPKAGNFTTTIWEFRNLGEKA